MLTISELLPLIVMLVVGAAITVVGIGCFGSIRTLDPPGDESSSNADDAGTTPVWQPSIERSPTSSTASITVPANPDRPLAYTVERLNGSERLRRLTVVYEQSLDDLESRTLRSAGFDSRTPTFDGVEDPRWHEIVRQRRESL